jgi:hypothetical protein
VVDEKDAPIIKADTQGVNVAKVAALVVAPRIVRSVYVERNIGPLADYEVAFEVEPAAASIPRT